MKEIAVEITREDIDAGSRKDCRKCPVALAMDRAMKSTHSWVVRSGADVWHGDDYLGSVTFNPRTSDFVRKFDTGQPVSPFSFSLFVPTARRSRKAAK